MSNDEQVSITVRTIKLILLVIFVIPSTISAFYIIYVSLRNSSFRQRFQNQTLIILICIILLMNLIHMPVDISYYARGFVWPQTPAFCLYWQTVDYLFFASPIWLIAIFTVQRYILVFASHFLRSKRGKCLVHHVPLIGSIVYLIVFYIVTHVTIECRFHYSQHTCGSDCLDAFNNLSMFNWFFNILFPVFIIIFGSLILLVHVLWTRRAMQRNLRHWSKNWKMIVQLLTLAAVYTLVWIPLSILSIMESFFEYTLVSYLTKTIFYFGIYLSTMAVPIISIFLFPELKFSFYRRFRFNIVSTSNENSIRY